MTASSRINSRSIGTILTRRAISCLSPHKTVVTTTDIHLPRRIGHALEHAFKGKLDTHYNEEEYFIRIQWRRDA